MKTGIGAHRHLTMLGFLVMAAPGISLGQGPTKADSGWVSLFNGTDFTGLYIHNGRTLSNPATQKSFLIEAGTIHVPKTGGVGHIATKAVYSRYHVRVQYKYGKGQSGPNAGLLYHIEAKDYQEGDAFGSQHADVPYFVDAYVKSVEYQMYRGDAGAFLGIMNIWVTAETKGDGNHTYQAGGTLYTAIPSNDLAPRRIYRSMNAAPNDTDWVQFDGLIYGADSVTHKVNGQVVMRGRNLKHNQKLTITTANDPDQVPMDKGHIGLQTEGAEVYYRNFEIRLLRPDGTPIIPGCMDPKASNYNPLANEDNKTCATTALGAAGDGMEPGLRFRRVSGGDRVEIGYRLPGTAGSGPATLEILTVKGERVRLLPLPAHSRGSVAWDLRDAGQRKVKRNFYLFRLRSGTTGVLSGNFQVD